MRPERIDTQPVSRWRAASVAGSPSCTHERIVTPGIGMAGSTMLNVTTDSGSSATEGSQWPLKVVVSRRPGSLSSTVPVIMSPPPAV